MQYLIGDLIEFWTSTKESDLEEHWGLILGYNMTQHHVIYLHILSPRTGKIHKNLYFSRLAPNFLDRLRRK
jgi:hypothetical protein